MYVGVLAIVLLGCMWWIGEMEFRTKVILTAIYLALWGFVFIPEIGGWFTMAGMALWCVVVGYWTFGKHFRM